MTIFSRDKSTVHINEATYLLHWCKRDAVGTRVVQKVLQLDHKEEWKCYNNTLFFNKITTEFSAFATFFWQTVNSTKTEIFCLSLEPLLESFLQRFVDKTKINYPQVHDCTGGCSLLWLHIVRPPCIQSWPGCQWLFSVPQSEVSPSWCPLSWWRSAQGSCQGVAGGRDKRFLF